MGRSRYKIYEEEYPYFMTSSVVDWRPVFHIPEAAQFILDGFKFLQDERRITLYAYVIMADHIHFIASGYDLTEKIRLFKSYTARNIIDLLKSQNRWKILQELRFDNSSGHKSRTYRFWQDGVHPKQIVGDKMMMQKIEYIHNNPVKRGYAETPQAWPYSSARNYLEQEGLIPVCCYGR